VLHLFGGLLLRPMNVGGVAGGKVLFNRSRQATEHGIVQGRERGGHSSKVNRSIQREPAPASKITSLLRGTSTGPGPVRKNLPSSAGVLSKIDEDASKTIRGGLSLRARRRRRGEAAIRSLVRRPQADQRRQGLAQRRRWSVCTGGHHGHPRMPLPCSVDINIKGFDIPHPATPMSVGCCRDHSCQDNREQLNGPAANSGRPVITREWPPSAMPKWIRTTRIGGSRLHLQQQPRARRRGPPVPCHRIAGGGKGGGGMMMMMTMTTTKEWDTPSSSRRVCKSLYQT
jgi:hypothetical protein